MTKLFWPLAVALVACRLYHFRPYLDHPHPFRQAGTACYSLGFHRYGMNILTPSVALVPSVAAFAIPACAFLALAGPPPFAG